MVKSYKKFPLVSIIMNCYNGEEYLYEAVQSVKDQSYKNWELIFWDNKSTDNSRRIIESFKDKRIKYFLAKEHSNLHVARNLALKKTKGSFFCFLDTDDYWDKNKISSQIVKFKDKNINFIYSNCWLVNKNYIFKKKILSTHTLPTGDVLDDMLKTYKVMLPTIMIRKSAFNKCKIKFNEKYKIIGDYEVCLKLASLWKFECVQQPLAYYRIHEKNFFILNKKTEIEELLNWYKNAKKFKYGKKIANNKNLKYLKKKIEYLKLYENYRKGGIFKVLINFINSSWNLSKIKFLIKIILPRVILKKISVYAE
tara:strand:- start:1548 stop:2477 length:930 start_codon:yes stop_codon:yes gene_type:complete